MARQEHYKAGDQDDQMPPSYSQATAQSTQRLPAREAAQTVASSYADQIPKICRCFPPSMAWVLIFTLVFLTVTICIAMISFMPEKQDPDLTFVGGFLQVECKFNKKSLKTWVDEEIHCGGHSYKYDCWTIKVDITTKYGTYPDVLMQGPEFESCSFTPPCDPDSHVRQAAIDNFISKYGTEGASFICYKTASGFSDDPFVERPEEKEPSSNNKNVMRYAIPSVLMLLCIAGIVAICWSGGGPVGLCQKCKRQKEIQQQAAEGLIALGGAIRRGDAVVVIQNQRH